MPVWRTRPPWAQRIAKSPDLKLGFNADRSGRRSGVICFKVKSGKAAGFHNSFLPKVKNSAGIYIAGLDRNSPVAPNMTWEVIWWRTMPHRP
jgi:hypothetical protein